VGDPAVDVFGRRAARRAGHGPKRAASSLRLTRRRSRSTILETGVSGNRNCAGAQTGSPRLMRIKERTRVRTNNAAMDVTSPSRQTERARR